MPTGGFWEADDVAALPRLDELDDSARIVVKQASTPSKAFVLPPEVLVDRMRAGLLVAAGLDPAIRPKEPTPLLWDDGANQLLVHLHDVEVRLGEGTIDVFLATECDQVGRDVVVCTFVTTTKERPAGFVWATERRPRGAPVVVDTWGEALVALCWRALVEIVRRATAERGEDGLGRPLVPSTVVATAQGIAIAPMVAHAFMRPTSGKIVGKIVGGGKPGGTKDVEGRVK